MATKAIIGGNCKKQVADAFYSQEVEVEGFNPIIQPVINVNEDFINIVKNATANGGATATIWTTPTDKDFYLTNVMIGQGTYYTYVTFYLGGAAVTWGNSSTVGNFSDTSFGRPIKIDRGTVITLTSGAASSSVASIAGFTRESYKK